MLRTARRMARRIAGVDRVGALLWRWVPARLVFSPEFLEWYHFLAKSEWWDEQRLKEYQWANIEDLLRHASENIPYYRDLFRELGASPRDFASFQDFSRFPILTKEILRERAEEFIPIGCQRSEFVFFTTGGSTGEPLGFYKDATQVERERAFMFNQWRRVGFLPRSSRVVLRGEVLPGGAMFHYEPQNNSHLFSSYRLNRDTAERYVRHIDRLKPDFLHVYPSVLWLMTSLMDELGLSVLHHPRGILCGSEPMYPFQRQAFERSFGCKAYSWLGMGEGVVLGGECEVSSDFHLFCEYSYVELVDEQGEIIMEPGIRGEIVGTKFHTEATPLVRYRTGDVGEWADPGPCQCGRQYPRLRRVEGRVQEYVYTKGGERFPIGPAIFGIHDNLWKDLRRLQFVQEQPGALILKAEKRGNPDMQRLKQDLSELFGRRFGDSVDLEVVFTGDIERTPAGKHRFLLQQLDGPRGRT